MAFRISATLCTTLLLGLSTASNAASNELRKQAQRFFQPIPTADILVREKNISDDQIELGKWLFFEPRLSKSHIISCNTCHSIGTGGADNIPASIGHGWQTAQSRISHFTGQH